MNEVKHTPTPTPWFIGAYGEVMQTSGVEFGGMEVKVNGFALQGSEIAKENTAFIVKAVNSHYTLTEQRDELLAALRLVKQNSDPDQFSRITQDKINAAIAKAEAKS